MAPMARSVGRYLGTYLLAARLQLLTYVGR